MTNKEAATLVAKMARDAYRDHLADIAILETQTRAAMVRRHNAKESEK